jgi:two-component system, chemotaxis family, response regulator Rcp1
MSNASKTSGLPEGKPLRQIQVLLVQSNPADSMLTMEAFKAAGLTKGLHCVSDGEDALMYVRRKGRYAKVRLPDLIFLDLSQPRVSGLEVLKAIKSTPALMHIPIVVAAGSDDPKFVRSVYALNGNCFIRKPGELAEFVRFIETCYEFWGNVVTLIPQRRKAPGRRTVKVSNSQTMAQRATAGSHK